jgi:hypothetical protein
MHVSLTITCVHAIYSNVARRVYLVAGEDGKDIPRLKVKSVLKTSGKVLGLELELTKGEIGFRDGIDKDPLAWGNVAWIGFKVVVDVHDRVDGFGI